MMRSPSSQPLSAVPLGDSVRHREFLHGQVTGALTANKVGWERWRWESDLKAEHVKTQEE